MGKNYVRAENGAYRITKTRVSLDSVVCTFCEGMSPESIADSFPVLKLEEVYSAIAYYLAHQAEVDAYLRQGETEFAALSERLKEGNAPLRQKLAAFRDQKQADTRSLKSLDHEGPFSGRCRPQPAHCAGTAPPYGND